MEIVEFENILSLDQPIQSNTLSRWERKARQQQQQPQDRYIPSRNGMDYDLANRSLAGNEEGVASTHSKLLSDTLETDNNDAKNSRILAFKNKAPAPAEGFSGSMRVLYSAANNSTNVAAMKREVKPTRHIPSAPVKILDAPDMLDDYCKLNYLSLQ
jgi:cell division cycle protein 20 (cofactor of APC complex)